MGMWVINRLKAELCPEKTFDEAMYAGKASSFDGLVDVNDERFLAPESMKAAFDSAFPEGEGPKEFGDYFRCAHRSLALGYKKALEQLAECTGEPVKTLYIVGGGARTFGSTNSLRKCAAWKSNPSPSKRLLSAI